MLFDKILGTFRSRIFGAFLLALLPILLLLAGAIEFFLTPSMQQTARQELSNSTRVLTSAIRTSAAVSVRNHLKAIAEKNREIATQHLSLVAQGLLSKEEAVTRLKAILLSQRIGNSGYIYCLDHNGVAVVHPNEKVEDTDNTRFDFVREQIKTKEGYLEYNWQNPGEQSPRPKALYMVFFEPLDWIISVSSYRSEFNEMLEPNDFRNTVSSLKFGASGYAYMFNKEGRILVHPQLKYLTDISNENPASDIIKPMLAQDSGSIEYGWRNPEEAESRQKIAVFEHIPEYGWIVVSSAYLDEIMGPVNLTVRIFYIAICIVLTAAVIATFFLSGRLSRPIIAMLYQLDKNEQNGTHEPLPELKNNELGRLAFEFNRFLKKIVSQKDQLRQERERYQSLFEASPDAVFLIRGLTIIDCNPATCSLFANKKTALLGRSILDLSPPKQSNNESSVLLAEKLTQQSSQYNLQTFEWIHQTTDGRLFDAEVRLKPFGTDNDELLLVAFVRDITERKQIEQSLRLTQFIFDKASIGIFRSGPKAQILNVNEQACKSLGYTAEELCTMSLFEIDPSLSLEKWEYLQQQRRETNTHSFESTHRAQNGRIFPVKITSNYLEFKDEWYSISFVRDITEEKNKEKQKERMEAHLNQSQRLEALGTLAGGIAHDFNNILSAIIGYTELTQLACMSDPKTSSHLSQLLAAGMRAKNLVSQILSFSRQSNLEKHPIDISKVIKEALTLIKISAPANVAISHNIKADLGIISANETQIHQIIMNLCTNAHHAMEEKGGKLEIELIPVLISTMDFKQYPELPPGQYLKLSVSDTGYGISPEKLPHIFDPYFTTKPVGEGSGLGLSTVHGIVKDHGGSIKVYSELQNGTTFQVFLPLTEVEPYHALTAEANLPRGNETILFVDNEELLLEIGKELLEGLGYSVETRASSLDALEAFRVHPKKYDLVVTDMTMPTLTGENLANKIQHINPDIPIILCTGYSTKLNMSRLKSIGIKKVLMKPVTLIELATAVRTILDEV